MSKNLLQNTMNHHNSTVLRFLDSQGIPYRVGTSADGADLLGEPILEAGAIIQLAELATLHPGLEQQSESIYRLLTWAKATGSRLKQALDQH